MKPRWLPWILHCKPLTKAWIQFYVNILSWIRFQSDFWTGCYKIDRYTNGGGCPEVSSNFLDDIYFINIPRISENARKKGEQF